MLVLYGTLLVANLQLVWQCIFVTFLPVAAGKNLINCYSIYILKMGRIYIKTCKKIE
jgi:hypothetical protein